MSSAACSIAVIANPGTAGMGALLVPLSCWHAGNRLSIQHSQSSTGVKLFAGWGHVHSLANYK